MEKKDFTQRYIALCDECLSECCKLMARHRLDIVATSDKEGMPIGDKLWRTSCEYGEDGASDKEIVALRYDKLSDTLWYATDYDYVVDCNLWISDWDSEYYCDILEVYDWLVAVFGLPADDK